MQDLDLPLIIEPEQLAPLLYDDRLVLIAVCQAKVFVQHHIPGSLLVEPGQLVSGVAPATGKMPALIQLQQLFSGLGLSPDKHVIVYDDEGGGWAGRLIWTLDMLNFNTYSYLNGGLLAWQGEAYPLATGPVLEQPSAVDFKASLNNNPRVTLQQVQDSIGDPNTVVWDARAADEYHGEKQTANRNGHIPGAVNLDWVDTMDKLRFKRLLPLDQLQTTLEELGISGDKQVITHCHTHHRSGLTYLIGKALGLNIKAYDGSWSEWGNHRDTPIEK